jgi:hypothetical protein
MALAGEHKMMWDTLRGVVVLLLLSVCIAQSALAAPIQVSLTTDKESYAPGEALRFQITARNVTDQDVVLQFGSSVQSQYSIDGGSPLPEVGLAVLTHQSIPAGGAFTWTYQHPWSEYPIAFGEHSAIARVLDSLRAPDASAPHAFSVVKPVLPTSSFLLNFDALPSSAAPMTTIEESWPFGVRFRSESTSAYVRPGLYRSADKTNGYVGINSTTYPVGFNLIADFDMPIHGASVNVSSAAGMTVTMMARDREGHLLTSVTSQPIPAVGDFSRSLSIGSVGDIYSLEWWPSQQNATVMIDNVVVQLPEPALLPAGLAAAILFARRPSRCAKRVR